MPDTGDCAEPDHHLLVDDEDRDEQKQHPQQAVPVVLAGLAVRGDTAGVVVADHDDQARADDREQRQESLLAGGPHPHVPDADPAQGTLDVADVCAVQHRGRTRGRHQRAPGRGRQVARG